MTVVSNASPLITLSKIGALHVLPELFGRLIVAAEVLHEVTARGAGRPGASEVQIAPWIEVRSYTNAAQFALWRTQHGLGAGETATILLAQELSANLAIIDERTARRLAIGLGLNCHGLRWHSGIGRAKKSHRRFAHNVSAVARRWNLH